MQIVYLVGGMMLVTFFIRYSLLMLPARIRFPAAFQKALGYVPPAVLTAIVVPAVLMPDGRQMHLSWRNPYLIGALLTVLLGRLSRNMLVTIVGGMAAFMLWQWAVGAF